MATLEDALNPLIDLSQLELVGRKVDLRPRSEEAPGPNPFFTSPLPGVNARPDSVRQFYRGTRIPRQRLIPTNGSSQTVTVTNTIIQEPTNQFWLQGVGNSIFYPSGSVGVGIANPRSAMDVIGNIRTSGAGSFGGSSIDDRIVVNVDVTRPNPQDDVLGGFFAIRHERTAVDPGWQVVPVGAVIEIRAGTTNQITGEQKPVVSEFVFVKPTSGTYIVDKAFNYEAKANFGQNTTVTEWYGFIVRTPASVNPTPGDVTTGYGVYIEDLDTTPDILDVLTAAAIKIDGLNGWGRILWTNAEINCAADGILELSASTLIQTTADFEVTGHIEATEYIESSAGHIDAFLGYKHAGAAALNDFLVGDGTYFIATTAANARTAMGAIAGSGVGAHTMPLRALDDTLGANGSLTWDANGVITAYVDPT